MNTSLELRGSLTPTCRWMARLQAIDDLDRDKHEDGREARAKAGAELAGALVAPPTIP